MEHTAFFGDGEKTFVLTRPMLDELQRTTGQGVGRLFQRFQAQDFSLHEIAETIRLGLIGGGTAPAEAAALVNTYVDSRPLIEGFEIAFDVLAARFLGTAEPAEAEQVSA